MHLQNQDGKIPSIMKKRLPHHKINSSVILQNKKERTKLSPETQLEELTEAKKSMISISSNLEGATERGDCWIHLICVIQQPHAGLQNTEEQKQKLQNTSWNIIIKSESNPLLYGQEA